MHRPCGCLIVSRKEKNGGSRPKVLLKRLGRQTFLTRQAQVIKAGLCKSVNIRNFPCSTRLLVIPRVKKDVLVNFFESY